uniref:Uncharacterized protein n=1 Tax=Arundo donax TaxID=35708 RepID=A0A0A8ZHP6_ARUDO
MQRRAAPPTD